MSYFGWDYHVYVFELNSKSRYLVPSESGEEDAWVSLSKRLSKSLENTKKMCKLIHIMNGNSNIIKL